ncbi:hypothetical protein [Synechococcus sp. CC9311]|uniref:DUF7734 family protein n=1 Tax=Synechococcus sp. (strain CC9311) TaxID=64471 RepID=UPI0000DDAA59|nr:hypothetical protein [Synechococcus sp. CC9311]ABI47127.1 conserved hypothetical protein [Synechococcus sp. CC9311]
MSSDPFLPVLEAISRDHPDRVLRLRGTVQTSEREEEVLEVLIFRGFSSCTTHSTDFDPDRTVLPDGAVLETGELLLGPLDPQQEQLLVGPLPADVLMDRDLWA